MNRIRQLVFALLTLLWFDSPLSAQAAETVFSGRPTLQVLETAVNRESKRLNDVEADGYQAVMSKIGDRYYWASRENRALVRLESGAFITYLAIDGSGYVRVIDPRFKAAASLMSETEDQFDYVEHILLGLRSIAYYGVSRIAN